MAIIKNFLYSSLDYTINTGVTPVIVNNEVIKSKIAVPRVIWNINFGLVKNDLHNWIENALFLDLNNLYLSIHVAPALKLFKVTGGAADFYTYRYLFEEAYYGSNYYDVTNRKLLFTTDGTYDYITDGNMIIAIASIGSIVVGTKSFPHYVHYIDKTLSSKHISQGVFELSSQLVEYFSPTIDSDISDTITYVGASDANNSGLL